MSFATVFIQNKSSISSKCWLGQRDGQSSDYNASSFGEHNKTNHSDSDDLKTVEVVLGTHFLHMDI